jgi:redox-sensitive bicupin YhaK (pirin superfamily)
VGDHNEFFQIWFEPHLEEAVRRTPTYREFANEDFPVEEKDGVRIKSVIGDGAPVTLVAEANMQDVVIQPGHRYQRPLAQGRTLAVMVIAGKGVLLDEATLGKHYLEPRYFSVVYAPENGTVTLQAEGDSPLRAAIIEVPATVNYPLYRNGR